MKLTRIIEKYLDGTLSDEEKKEFTEYLEKDSEFRELLQLHEEANKAIADDTFFMLKEKLHKAYQQYETESGNISEKPEIRQFKGLFKLNNKRILSLAAGFILIAASVLIWYLFYHSGSQGDRLFAAYYQLYNPDIIYRSAERSTSKWQDALLLYKEHKWQEAESLFSDILALDSTDTAALFYSGMADIELNRIRSAIDKLHKIINIGDSGYVIHARWYLGLLYCKIDDKQSARRVLQPLVLETNFYSKKAASLLRRL
jgi:hypothetical protein